MNYLFHVFFNNFNLVFSNIQILLSYSIRSGFLFKKKKYIQGNMEIKTKDLEKICSISTKFKRLVASDRICLSKYSITFKQAHPLYNYFRYDIFFFDSMFLYLFRRFTAVCRQKWIIFCFNRNGTEYPTHDCYINYSALKVLLTFPIKHPSLQAWIYLFYKVEDAR